jgi:hypothetical protein
MLLASAVPRLDSSILALESSHHRLRCIWSVVMMVWTHQLMRVRQKLRWTVCESQDGRYWHCAAELLAVSADSKRLMAAQLTCWSAAVLGAIGKVYM